MLSFSFMVLSLRLWVQVCKLVCWLVFQPTVSSISSLLPSQVLHDCLHGGILEWADGTMLLYTERERAGR